MTTNKKKSHNYRISLYLGKETYNKLSEVAQFLSIPLATTTRILLETGLQLSSAIEKKTIEGINNGKSKV